MIRINLLPRKYPVKKTKAAKPGGPGSSDSYLYVLVAAVIVCGVIIGAVWLKNSKDISRLQSRIAELNKQNQAMQPLTQEFSKIEKEKKQISDRISVIDKLLVGRTLPPRMLYDLSGLTKDNLWLKKLVKSETGMELEGRSVDNETLCDFVEHLSKLPYIKDLELKSVEDVTEHNMTIKKFFVKGSVS
jgi:Tfp pilus assembly protein PilN